MEDSYNQNQDFTENPISNDSKIIGILSYIGPLWIVAYILYNKSKSEYTTFNVRQGLGIFIFAIINWIISGLPFIGWLSFPIGLIVLAFSIIGILNAAKGEQKDLPIIGELINENLKNFK